ncbi:SRPBCC family protein [Pseudonocardia sp. DSM 110487]|nr:SRPBCC family protein [Pseudonocardia sp. DSM 110487]
MAETTTKKVKEAAPTDALRDAGQQLLALLVQRAAEAATERVTGLSERLSGVAEQGLGLREALNSNGNNRGGGGGSVAGLLSRGVGAVADLGARKGLGALKEKVQSAVGSVGGAGQKLKVTVISEDLEVGLPLRTTYDLWTRFADFPSFMKKVERVEQTDDVTTTWTAQVLWSHRTWESTIVEQVPDSHIVWRSEGAKGRVDGAVTFTELGPNLTRVLLVLEYHPQGLFEHTGNLWRAQGRRARLEFQHFRRHAMRHVLIHQDDVEGWRGEIRDGEVVRTHEEAIEEERREQEEYEEYDEAEEPDESDEVQSDDEGPDDEYYADDEFTDEEKSADEELEEPVPASRARRPAAANSTERGK